MNVKLLQMNSCHEFLKPNCHLHFECPKCCRPHVWSSFLLEMERRIPSQVKRLHYRRYTFCPSYVSPILSLAIASGRWFLLSSFCHVRFSDRFVQDPCMQPLSLLWKSYFPSPSWTLMTIFLFVSKPMGKPPPFQMDSKNFLTFSLTEDCPPDSIQPVTRFPFPPARVCNWANYSRLAPDPTIQTSLSRF